MRDVEPNLAERDTLLAHEGIRRWSVWFSDEVFLRINDQLHYLWRGGSGSASFRARYDGAV